MAINRFAKAALARTFPGVALVALFSCALDQAGNAVDLDTVYELSRATLLGSIMAAGGEQRVRSRSGTATGHGASRRGGLMDADADASATRLARQM